MTDLCVEKTNQILTLGQPPQNLFKPQALEFRTPFSSFGPSRDYGMDLCLEVYLWAIYPYFTTFRVTTLSFY